MKLFSRGSTAAQASPGTSPVIGMPSPEVEVDSDLAAATSHRELELLIRHDVHWIQFEHLDAAPLTTAIEVGSQFRRLALAYGHTAARVGALRIERLTEGGKRCLGLCFQSSDRPIVISLSERHLSAASAERTQQSLVMGSEVQFHPPGCNSWQSVVTHEWGHALQHVMESLSGDEGARSEVDAILTKKTAKRISRYATAGRAELFAEAFSMIHHTPEALRPPEIAELESLLVRKFGHEGSFRPYVPARQTDP